MSPNQRRQWVLLALLGVLVFVYFRYSGASASPSAGAQDELPPLDIAGVLRGLQGVNTVKPDLIDIDRVKSDPDRNLFQYGERRAPGPPPMTEDERKAAELRLVQLEQEARMQQEQERAAAAQAAATQAAAAQVAQAALTQPPPQAGPPGPPPPPPPPVKPPPPAINYRFVGVMGSPKKKVGVFMDGDKMLLARKGEVIEARFRVIDIGAEWADWGYVNPDWKDQRKRLYFGK